MAQKIGQPEMMKHQIGLSYMFTTLDKQVVITVRSHKLEGSWKYFVETTHADGQEEKRGFRSDAQAWGHAQAQWDKYNGVDKS